jgi:hypothetical protein
VAARVLTFVLAGAGVAGAVGSVAGSLSDSNEWDRFGWLCAAVIFSALGAFFLRQTLRRERGQFWTATVRPFLKSAVAATLIICFLPPLLGLPLGGDEVMVLVVIGSAAVGIGIALAVLRRAPGQGLIYRGTAPGVAGEAVEKSRTE